MPPLPGWLAFCLPMIVFMVGTYIEGQDWAKPHYPAWYTLKCVLVIVALWWGLPRYPKWNSNKVVVGFVLGLLLGAVWVGICYLEPEQYLIQLLPETVKGWVSGDRSAYNPFEVLESTTAWFFFFIRCVGLSLLVPLMEEVFWRGFLARFFLHDDFEKAPIGEFNAFTFWLITILFVSMHPEWLAALVWGISINLFCKWSKNLWACVAFHAGSNLFLGVYVLVMHKLGYNVWKLL